MSFLDKVTALIPFGKKKETSEYFFALNVSSEKLTCALWTIENKHLKILQTAEDAYSTLDDLTPLTDKLLDQVVGIKELDPQKILFGVPSSWLADENLKEEKLKVLRGLVKELELTPMAYVESSHALIHFLEKSDGVVPTAILVGFETHHLSVAVVRAGKLDGVKVISRGENSGVDIEKALLTFTAVETLPSKILIYGADTDQLKNQLLAYPWMSKLSFLHFPKIDTMPDDIEIKSVCFAGASEIDSGISYTEKPIAEHIVKSTHIIKNDENLEKKEKSISGEKENLGFMVGDVSTHQEPSEQVLSDSEVAMDEEYLTDHPAEELTIPQESNLVETDDFERELPAPVESELASATSALGQLKKKFSLKKFLPKKFKNSAFLVGAIGAILLIVAAYFLLPKAEVKIFVEPKILEKDATVTADPNQKTVDEEGKVIPGQIIETQVSGSGKDTATGQKEVGNPAKGTIVIYNKTFDSISLSKGIQITSKNGTKFILDNSVPNIASASSTVSGIVFGKASANPTVTAIEVGADGNLPSTSEFTISGYSSDKLSAVAEGNFSGGTSKTVTVVSSDDQKKLLATLASTLRKQAQQQLQEKLSQKKILEEALLEEIVKKSFNKNINDQASEFSLNLTANYKGTAFEDKDLRSIVSKLVVTQVPEGYKLNLEDTETQADVSKLEKSGKLIFLAKFKAKMLPKIDIEKVKNQIKGKSLQEAANIIKNMDNVLGSEIKVSPKLPSFLQRLPILGKNIKIEVGLK